MAAPDWLKPALSAKPKVAGLNTDTNPQVTAARLATPKAATGSTPAWLAGAIKPPKAALSGGGHGSNFADIRHMVTGLPGAVGHLAKEVGHDVVYAPLKDIAENVAHPGSFGKYRGPEVKLPAQTAKSFERTGGRVVHPGRYVEAYRRGTLPSALIEDLANISIVGSVGGSVLRSGATGAIAEEAAARSAAGSAAHAAGIGGEPGLSAAAAETAGRVAPAEAAANAARATTPYKIGTVLHDVGHLGARGANLPAAPYTAAAKLIKGIGDYEHIPGLRGVSLAAKVGETRLGEAAANARESLAARRTTREFNAAEKAVPQGTAHYELLKDAPAAFKGLDPVEQRAAVLVADQTFAYPGTREQLRLAEDHAGQAGVDAFFERLNKDAPKGSQDAAYAVTPEAAKIAIAFHEGTLAPEVAAKVSGLVDYLRGASNKLTERAVAGAGRLSGPLNPEQLGTEHVAEALQTRGVTKAEGLLAGRKEQLATAKTRAAVAEGYDIGGGMQVEAKVARATPAIVSAGERQVALEGRRTLLSEGAVRLRAKADEVLGIGQEKGAALRGQAEAARTEGLTLAGQVPKVQAESDLLRGQAATAAEANQAKALPRFSTAESDRAALGDMGILDRSAVIGPEAGPKFRGATRLEAGAQRLNLRAEGSFAREEALRLRATAAENTAVDTAVLTEGQAVKAESRLAGLAGEAPLRNTAARELGQTARAGERAGVYQERLNQAQQTVARSERKVGTAERRLEVARQKAWDNIDSWPARYRYAGGVAREAAAAGSDLVAELRSKGVDYAADAIQKALDEYPATLEAMVAAGVDPIYLPGGIDPNTRVASGLQRSRGETALSQRKVGSEYERQTMMRPATPQGRLARINQEQMQVIENIAADKFLTEHGRRPADVGVTETRDQQILDAMREKGYEPWDPRAQDGTPRKVTPDTAFLPTELRRAIEPYFKPANRAEVFLQHTFDPTRRLWKDLVLPYSGTWQVGNIISNAIMSTVGTGSLRWVTELPDALKMIREGTGPARLNRLGVDYPLNDLMRNKTGKVPGRIRRMTNASYAFNTFMDDWSRHSVYLAEHAKLVEGGADAAAAEAQSIRSALKVSGDFNNMTHFEKAYIRRAAPFYAWARHVSRLVSYLAKEHPARLVWTLHLSDMFNDPNQSPFQDSIGVKGGIFSLGNLNPLGQAANLYFNERGPLAGAAQALGPELDIAAAAGLGINLSRGGAPLRLPPGAGKLDNFGNPTPTALLGRGRDLARYGLAQVPLVNTGRDLAFGQKLARYDTGQPMLKGGNLIDSSPRILGTDITGRLGILARQAGVPTATPFDVPAATTLAQKRVASAAAASKKYRAQLKRAGG